MSLWDRKAPVYSRIRRLAPFRQILSAENRAVQELLAQAAAAARGWAVDLGCGDGNAARLLQRSDRLVLVDRSLAMVRRARSRVGAPAVVADAGALPFRMGTFSLILTVGLVEYLPEVDGLVAEIGSVARPQAAAIITVAPVKWANRLRRALGSPLFWHRGQELERQLRALGFCTEIARETWLQQQILFRRNDVRSDHHPRGTGSQSQKH